MWTQPVIVASGFAQECYYGPCYPYDLIPYYEEYGWGEEEDDRY